MTWQSQIYAQENSVFRANIEKLDHTISQLENKIISLEAELERWRQLHGADNPEDAIVVNMRGKEANLALERLNRIRELESQNANFRRIIDKFQMER